MAVTCGNKENSTQYRGAAYVLNTSSDSGNISTNGLAQSNTTSSGETCQVDASTTSGSISIEPY